MKYNLTLLSQAAGMFSQSSAILSLHNPVMIPISFFIEHILSFFTANKARHLLNFRFCFVHHTHSFPWILKNLDFLRKTPLTAYEFGIIRKSITNRKADRLCRTAFSGISMPENHTPLSCFKIDGLKSASKSIQKPQIFIKKSSFFHSLFSFRAFILFMHQKCKSRKQNQINRCTV